MITPEAREHYRTALNEIIGDGTPEGALISQEELTDVALARDLIDLDALGNGETDLTFWLAGSEFVTRVLTRHNIALQSLSKPLEEWTSTESGITYWDEGESAEEADFSYFPDKHVLRDRRGAIIGMPSSLEAARHLIPRTVKESSND